MERIRHTLTSNRTLTMVIAAVVAIGLVLAISTFAAGPKGGKAKPASTLTIKADGLPKAGATASDDTPTAPPPPAALEEKVSPATYRVQCQGSPGNQRFRRDGSLGPAQSRELKIGFEKKSQRLSCTITVTAPRGYQTSGSDQRKVTLKPGKPLTVSIPFRQQ